MTVLADHLAYLHARNYAESTITQRRYVLGRLTRTGVDPVHATTADLLRFLMRLKHAPSRASETAHLRSFYRWAVLENYRDDDPTIRVPKPRLPGWLPHPIGEPDLIRAVNLAPDRVRPWLFLAAFAGLRACEIAPLRGEDLWWHSDPPIIVVRRGKGGEPDSVPIAPALACELDGLAQRGWLFPRGDGQGGPLPAHRVSQIANGYLHRIGIAHTLHSLRHRFGTQCLRLSGNLRHTQSLMRHKSIVSTTIYTLVEKSETAAVVAALPLVV